jgi:dihydrofolate reductase
MAKLIAWNMLSLDGYFEGPQPGQLEWFAFNEQLQDYILETQMQAGALLFGRRTFEFMAKYWPQADPSNPVTGFMNNVPKYVFSRTLSHTDWQNSTIMRGDLAETIGQLKEQVQGDIFIFGSAEFTHALNQQRLVDEYRFGINPYVLNRGTAWFKGGPVSLKLQLTHARVLDTGLIIAHYQPVEVIAHS